MEFAIALPMLVLVVLGAAQIGLTIRNELAVELAAREGARAAATAADTSGAAHAAALRAVDLPVQVSTRRQGGAVQVTVTYTDPTSIAIIGRFIAPITHVATVTMALEPP